MLAARTMGASTWRIISVHILPNVLVVVLTSLPFAVEGGDQLPHRAGLPWVRPAPAHAELGRAHQPGNLDVPVRPLDHRLRRGGPHRSCWCSLRSWAKGCVMRSTRAVHRLSVDYRMEIMNGGWTMRTVPRLGGLMLSLAARAWPARRRGAWAQAYTSKAVDADEKAMAAEKRPSFASPAVVDKDSQRQRPAGEADLVHQQARHLRLPPRKAGRNVSRRTSRSSLTPSAPSVPNANDAYRPFFTTSPGLVDNNGETKEWMPAMATDWAFGADGRSVYFKLNEKARWTDGDAGDLRGLHVHARHDAQPVHPGSLVQRVLHEAGRRREGIRGLRDKGAGRRSHGRDDLLLQRKPHSAPPAFLQRARSGRTGWTRTSGHSSPPPGPTPWTPTRKANRSTFRKVKDWWGYQYDYNRYRFNVDTLEFRVITGGNDIVRNYFYNGEIDSYPLIIPAGVGRLRRPASRSKKGYIDRAVQFLRPPDGGLRHHPEREGSPLCRRPRAAGAVLRHQHPEDDRHGAAGRVQQVPQHRPCARFRGASRSTTTASGNPASTRKGGRALRRGRIFRLRAGRDQAECTRRPPVLRAPLPVAQPHRAALGAEGRSEKGRGWISSSSSCSRESSPQSWKRSSRPGGERCPRTSTMTTGSTSTP